MVILAIIIVLAAMLLIILLTQNLISLNNEPNLEINANSNNFRIFPLTEEQTINKINKNKSSIQLLNNKISLVSLSVGDRKFSKITKNSLYNYAKLYNYDVHYYDKTLDSNYTVMWQKPLAVKDVLNMKENGEYKYDCVVWIDDDMYITNPDFRIEDFINLSSKDIILSRDIINEDYNYYINAGIYIIKNTEFGRRFIQDVIDGYDFFNGFFKNKACYEQPIMIYLFFQYYYDDIDVLPYGVLQSFYHRDKTHKNHFNGKISVNSRLWKSGDFIAHFAGLSNEYRDKNIPKLEKLVNI